MKYCTKCGAQLTKEMLYCPNCGAMQSNMNPTNNQQVENAVPPQQPVINVVNNQPQTKTTDGFCVAGFVLSFFINILGLIFSIIGLIRVKKDETKAGKGLAVAGLVLSLISFIFIILCWVTALAAFSSMPN